MNSSPTDPTIELLVLDVDGVLTDGCLVASAEGEPAKTFCVRDGMAIVLWQRCGGRVAILSGRSELAVSRRAEELGIEIVHTGVEDKSSGFKTLLKEAGTDSENVCYVGDDLPDLAPMNLCALPVAVANAGPDVKRAAHYVTRCRGGDGAVAEVVELLLRKRGAWSRAITEMVGACRGDAA